jgi:nifR3 family TIM-barrel protein
MQTFWNKLSRPFCVLAPMADVTDAAFRRMFAKYGPPDVFWTEFVSADGLFHTREKLGMPDADNPLMVDLLFSEAEHPIVAQLFGSNTETMEYTAELVARLGFDGIDINMGCPDRSVEKQGAGAGMIKNPERAIAIVAAARRGAARASASGTPIPVSVKTRIGYAKRDELEEWIPRILSAQPAALTVHARTRNEMSLVPARWEHVARAVALRDVHSPHTLIIGNGDVATTLQGKQWAQHAGADGAMIGRGIFGNPWRFRTDIDPDTIALSQKLDALSEHTQLFAELLPHKSFAIMKKHFKAYVHGFSGAAELRAKLMEAPDANTVTRIIASVHNAS